MNMDTWYPAIRRNLDRYRAEELAERIDELLAYNEPIVVTHPRRPPMVMLPAHRYDDLLAAMVACNNLIEQRRQAVEPLPPLDVKP